MIWYHTIPVSYRLWYGTVLYHTRILHHEEREKRVGTRLVTCSRSDNKTRIPRSNEKSYFVARGPVLSFVVDDDKPLQLHWSETYPHTRTTVEANETNILPSLVPSNHRVGIGPAHFCPRFGRTNMRPWWENLRDVEWRKCHNRG